jgi:hypothetical protein
MLLDTLREAMLRIIVAVLVFRGNRALLWTSSLTEWEACYKDSQMIILNYEQSVHTQQAEVKESLSTSK